MPQNSWRHAMRHPIWFGTGEEESNQFIPLRPVLAVTSTNCKQSIPFLLRSPRLRGHHRPSIPNRAKTKSFLVQHISCPHSRSRATTMLAWKEKLSDKLARLLADSPSSPSPPSPVAKSESHVTPFTEDFTSPKKSSLSSYVLSFLPSAAVNPSSPSCVQTLQPLPPESLPIRWNSGEWEYKKVVLSDNEDDERIEDTYGNKFEEKVEDDKNLKSCNGYEERKLGELRSDRNEEKKSNTLHSDEYQKRLSDKSEFITLDLFEFLESTLPSTIKGSRWVLLYSTWKHGISLRTLLRRSADLPGPCLLVVGDLKGATFGGLLECPLKPTPKRKYQGTSQTFVYTTRYGQPRLFRPTGANRYFYLCLDDALAFGGGGSFALCLDEDLLHGTSGPSETFGNECLAHDAEFELKNVELWGFTYLPRHIAD